ncbi:hypothetical protein ASD44_14930 [Mesorhizobium sp. Root554]|uniref:DUF2934 domain-containing protein n=1 Tax=unclassified Mesorhizobium TaxID=325217 RepID=UPI000700528A|nr:MULTISPECIES: DUF2934 domain-containing protein [unclassified Mesorhizobium]KQZ15203.1 hypothetical protein ASD27_14935 [Mesorhizobium sp. Root1471]KQZ37712.1 hypothetical protein ASD44_14930 [Mesorhizobium sp. Root554]
MFDDKQDRIRKRAHAIWENEGRPDGAHERHWHQAATEIDAEKTKSIASSKKSPARAKAATKPAGKSAASAKAAKPRKG